MRDPRTDPEVVACKSCDRREPTNRFSHLCRRCDTAVGFKPSPSGYVYRRRTEDPT